MTLVKKCCTCKDLRPVTEFNKRARALDGLQARCRRCSREWYLANRESHRKKVAARTNAHRKALSQKIGDYLLDHPCVDCGEADLRVLDFDHRDPELKRGTVGRLVSNAPTWESLLVEIEKCDVRCANCHRIRTSEQFGWWRNAAEAARRADGGELEGTDPLVRLEVVSAAWRRERTPVARGVWRVPALV